MFDSSTSLNITSELSRTNTTMRVLRTHIVIKLLRSLRWLWLRRIVLFIMVHMFQIRHILYVLFCIFTKFIHIYHIYFIYSIHYCVHQVICIFFFCKVSHMLSSLSYSLPSYTNATQMTALDEFRSTSISLCTHVIDTLHPSLCYFIFISVGNDGEMVGIGVRCGRSSPLPTCVTTFLSDASRVFL